MAILVIMNKAQVELHHKKGMVLWSDSGIFFFWLFTYIFSHGLVITWSHRSRNDHDYVWLIIHRPLVSARSLMALSLPFCHELLTKLLTIWLGLVRLVIDLLSNSRHVYKDCPTTHWDLKSQFCFHNPSLLSIRILVLLWELSKTLRDPQPLIQHWTCHLQVLTLIST